MIIQSLSPYSSTEYLFPHPFFPLSTSDKSAQRLSLPSRTDVSLIWAWLKRMEEHVKRRTDSWYESNWRKRRVRRGRKGTFSGTLLQWLKHRFSFNDLEIGFWASLCKRISWKLLTTRMGNKCRQAQAYAQSKVCITWHLKTWKHKVTTHLLSR